MNEAVFLIIMFVFGAVFGSFACCQAWRLRLKEEGRKSPGKRSVCMGCGKKLKVSENIPILSWTFQKGKCKKCGAKIGWAEILSEIGLAIVFVLIGTYFYEPIFAPAGGAGLVVGGVSMLSILKMVVLIFAVTAMWVVVVYDAKWGRMPNMGLLFSGIFAAIYLVIAIIFEGIEPLSLLGAIGFLPGLYYILYIFSKEKLVGGGDWLFAMAIALILHDWFLALVVLFASNFLASVFSIPIMLKHGKKAQVPFGPFLFIGFLVVYLLQDLLLKLLVI